MLAKKRMRNVGYEIEYIDALYVNPATGKTPFTVDGVRETGLQLVILFPLEKFVLFRERNGN